MHLFRIPAILATTSILIFSTLTNTKAVSIPSGFKQILADNGVKVYKTDNNSSRTSYITMVNLNYGSLSNLTGAVTNRSLGEVERKSINDFWSDAIKENTSVRTAKVVINGSFFSQKKYPTPIAFGLKVAGRIISYGYGLDEFPNLINIFSFNSLTRNVSIQPYKKEILDSSVTDIIGALNPMANKSAEKYLPRTFVGVRDNNGDGLLETVIFYSSNSARQVDAVNSLKDFGASSTAMLDGGSSTGLIINGKTYILPNRTIPHAIDIYAGRYVQSAIAS